MSSQDTEKTDVEVDVFFPNDNELHEVCLERANHEHQRQQKRDAEEPKGSKPSIKLIVPKKKRRTDQENPETSKAQTPSYVMMKEGVLLPMNQYIKEVRGINHRPALTSLSVNKYSDIKNFKKPRPVKKVHTSGKRVIDQENLYQDEETKQKEEEEGTQVFNFPYTAVSSVTFPPELFSADPVYGTYKKVPLTLTCMAVLCINSSPTKTAYVNQMYDYVEKSFPHYKNLGGTWKNSLRHNISVVDDNFKKVENSCLCEKKGFAWTINPERKKSLRILMKTKRITKVEDLNHTLGSSQVVYDMRDNGLLAPDVVISLFGEEGNFGVGFNNEEEDQKVVKEADSKGIHIKDEGLDQDHCHIQ
jgi:hypothetical protein